MMTLDRGMRVVSGILLVLVVGACDVNTQSETAREEAVPEHLEEGRYLLDPVTVEKLTIWPVCTDEPSSLGEFMTLKEAEESGCVTLKEDSTSGDGQVNRIVVENRGSVPILICAGTVIKGGQQDRQIGQDSVVAARGQTSVETFCVERGRWGAIRAGAATQGRFTGADYGAPKAVRESAQYDGDQSLVWQNVGLSNAIAGKSPKTSTLLATLEETDAERNAVRARVATAIESHFESVPAEEHVVGFAYALGSKPMGMRIFADPKLFEAQFPTLLHSMAMEADLADNAVSINTEAILNFAVATSSHGNLRGLAALNTADAVTDDLTDGNRQAVPPTYESATNRRPSAVLSSEILNGKPPTAADMMRMVARINAAGEQARANPADNRTGVRRNELGGSARCYVPTGRSSAERSSAWITLTQDWTSR